MKKNNPWITLRSEGDLKNRLAQWQEKFRRPTLSDAIRIILEDRLSADKIK